MNKEKSRLASPLFDKNDRARQESPQKTRGQMSLILSLVWAVIFGGVSAPLAAMTCGAPDSCVVTLYLYYSQPYTTTDQNKSYSFSSVDTTCAYIVPVQKKPPVVGSTTVYEGMVHKLFFNGTGWSAISAGSPIDIFGEDGTSLISSVTYSVSFTSFISMKYSNPYKYLPANCSFLPPPSLSQTANPDSGDPTCNQVPLN